MEPDKQVEIQLGHMCNNRCVFCVSGQRTEMREAFPLAADPIKQRITGAYEQGNRKITLLGGEPTLQPGFMDVVRHCVALGFEEIVVFTNGVKTARASFVDEVLETGGRFTWRISIQGATKETHERTTKKPGSFDRIVQSMEHMKARGERITVNMCVVRSNFEAVDRFPELLLPFGVDQLHLDMVRPRDAGIRTDEEFAAMIPRYGDLVGPLTRMVEGFPDGFDVNIGNLPYCVAPHLSPWIHHDGQKTFTIAIDDDDRLSEAWDKYEDKRTDKLHPESCAPCLFRDRCNGVFDRYVDLYGTDELVPVTAEALADADPERRLLPVHLKPVLRGLAEDLELPPGFDRLEAAETGDDEVTLVLHGPEPLAVAVRPPAEGGLAATEAFSLHVRRLPVDETTALAGLRAIWSALAPRGGALVHPLGDDAVRPMTRSVAGRLLRLKRAAPFGALAWTGTALTAEGARAELRLEGPSGEAVVFWLDEKDGRPSGGYRLEGEADPALVEGLRALMGTLRKPEPDAAAAG